MKNLFTSTLFLLSLNVCLFSQSTGNISGSIIDAEKNPISYASVVLYTTADSILVKMELSDESGNFTFTNIPNSEYWIELSFVGHPNHTTEPFILSGNIELPAIQLEPSTNELQEVTVTAQRPLLEVKPDKMVFNVENSINAVGSDAFELLRKAPGVVVDNNDNINLLGKSGVLIYIDGKQSPLQGEQLVTYLKSMQATEIDNIEIITNPSAKYDAEGSAGIINIRLKKDKGLGANASINLGFSQGEYAQYNGSISSNYKAKKYNVYGSYSYNDGESGNYMDLYRQQNNLVLDQKNNRNNEWNSHNFKLGSDFYLNKNSTLGFMVDGNIAANDRIGNSRTNISMVGEAIDSILIAQSLNNGGHDNYNFNINYTFGDGKDVETIFDANYGLYRNEGKEFQPNQYYDPTESIKLTKNVYRNDRFTDIDIFALKVDHERPLLKGKLGLGAKATYIKTDNGYNFYNVYEEPDSEELDIDRSNQFVYTENVNAAYANYTQQFKKLGFQVGLRIEQTNSEGDLSSQKVTENDNVTQTYVDFFPSAGITYQMNPKNSLQLSYSRRITRPNYQDLNPFDYKLDELTFQKGNPFLNPEYTNNIQLTHTYNYSINTSIGFSQTTDLITRIVDTVGVKGSFITWENLDEQRNFNASVSGSVPITKWWSTYTSLTGYHTQNKSKNIDGKSVDIGVTTFNVYSQFTFKLPWKLSVELSGWYNSPSIWGGTFKMDQQWSMDAGIQKKLFNDRGTLRISYSDIFDSNHWHGISQYGALYMNVGGGWDSQRIRVNFSYLFGNNQIKSRKRNTGLEDESKRIKND